MRILLAFDTDGTFWTDEDKSEYICGIIDPVKLYNKLLSEDSEPIVGCFVVSESPFYPKYEINGRKYPLFPLVNDQANRYYNLLKAREESEKIWGKADICLYIDDQAIWKKDAENAGFIYVEAGMFADMFNVRHV